MAVAVAVRHGRASGRRKFRLGAALVAAGLTVTACGPSGAPDEDTENEGEAADPGTSDEEVTLTYWTHTHPPMVELNEQLIAEYEDENPNVTVNYEIIPNDDFGTRMLTALSSGSGPDIINMDDQALRGEYIPKELVVPVDAEAMGYESTDELLGGYNEGVFDGAIDHEGSVYGVPSEFNSTAFAINRQLFKEAGLDPDSPPETWDDVSEMGQAIVDQTDAEGYNFLYLHDGWYAQQFSTLLQQTGGRILNEEGTESVINEAGAVEALSIWHELIVEDEVGDPDRASRESTVPFDDFGAGRRAMNVVYPWGVAQLEDQYPETYEDIEVVPLPQVEGSSPTQRWYAYYWAVNSASDRQAEAWRFIDFLASHPERWLEEVDFVQPVTGWEETGAAQEIPFVDVWAEAYSTGQFDEVGPNWNEIQGAIRRAIERSIFDGVEPQVALDEAKEEIDQILSS